MEANKSPASSIHIGGLRTEDRGQISEDWGRTTEDCNSFKSVRIREDVRSIRAAENRGNAPFRPHAATGRERHRFCLNDKAPRGPRAYAHRWRRLRARFRDKQPGALPQTRARTARSPPDSKIQPRSSTRSLPADTVC